MARSKPSTKAEKVLPGLSSSANQAREQAQKLTADKRARLADLHTETKQPDTRAPVVKLTKEEQRAQAKETKAKAKQQASAVAS